LQADPLVVVVDASAALKWILDENGRAAALELLEEDVLHAPDFVLVEVANVLWSKVRRHMLEQPQEDVAYEAIATAPWPKRLWPSPPSRHAALRMRSTCASTMRFMSHSRSACATPALRSGHGRCAARSRCRRIRHQPAREVDALMAPLRAA